MGTRTHEGQPTLLGAIALSIAMTTGCAAQHDDALRLSEELGRARADAAWQQAHAAELESRVARLEQSTRAGVSASSNELQELQRRLDRLMAMNESLLAARIAAVAPSPTPAANAPPVASPKAAPGNPPAATLAPTGAVAPSEEQQLRALVERMRGRPGRPHGGLTREQEEALRVLTRPERTLDTENPWAAAFY